MNDCYIYKEESEDLDIGEHGECAYPDFAVVSGHGLKSIMWGGQELTGDFRTLSISRSGFQSRQPLRQGVGYGNPTCKAVVICTYYEVTDSPIARLRIDPGLVDGK